MLVLGRLWNDHPVVFAKSHAPTSMEVVRACDGAPSVVRFPLASSTARQELPICLVTNIRTCVYDSGSHTCLEHGTYIADVSLHIVPGRQTDKQVDAWMHG